MGIIHVRGINYSNYSYSFPLSSHAQTTTDCTDDTDFYETNTDCTDKTDNKMTTDCTDETDNETNTDDADNTDNKNDHRLHG